MRYLSFSAFPVMRGVPELPELPELSVHAGSSCPNRCPNRCPNCPNRISRPQKAPPPIAEPSHLRAAIPRQCLIPAPSVLMLDACLAARLFGCLAARLLAVDALWLSGDRSIWPELVGLAPCPSLGLAWELMGVMAARFKTT